MGCTPGTTPEYLSLPRTHKMQKPNVSQGLYQSYYSPYQLQQLAPTPAMVFHRVWTPNISYLKHQSTTRPHQPVFAPLLAWLGESWVLINCANTKVCFVWWKYEPNEYFYWLKELALGMLVMTLSCKQWAENGQKLLMAWLCIIHSNKRDFCSVFEWCHSVVHQTHGGIPGKFRVESKSGANGILREFPEQMDSKNHLIFAKWEYRRSEIPQTPFGKFKYNR